MVRKIRSIGQINFVDQKIYKKDVMQVLLLLRYMNIKEKIEVDERLK